MLHSCLTSPRRAKTYLTIITRWAKYKYFLITSFPLKYPGIAQLDEEGPVGLS
jgi:hypothetical protein